jgi:chromosomal replication initiator protein
MLEALWGRMLISLATRVPPAVLDSWLRPCRLAAVEGDHVKIAAPNTYTRDWLHQHHTESLQAAAVKSSEAIHASRSTSTATPSPASAQNETEPPVAAQVSPSATPSTFLRRRQIRTNSRRPPPGESPSRHALTTPLFIYGGVGLGKPTSLHAVGHQIARLYPQLRLLYTLVGAFH